MRVIAILLLLVLPSCAGADESTPSQILESISINGATETVRSLYEARSQWFLVMQRVSAGDPKWLAVAKALYPGTDAGASSELENAVFLALAHSPELVLKILRISDAAGDFSVRQVCSSNIGIDFPADEATRMIRERISILEKLQAEDVASQRDACLSALRKAVTDFED